MRKYNYTLNHRISQRHEDILNMYLDGATQAQMLDRLIPDRKTKHEGDSLLKKILMTLRISLRMPFDRKSCIKNKDIILNNLTLIKEYCAAYDDFIANEDKALINKGFLNLNDL